jgi:hypothetical protein
LISFPFIPTFSILLYNSILMCLQNFYVSWQNSSEAERLDISGV